MTDLETQLKEAIKASGMNQPQLAELSGVDQGQISRFIKGERSLTLKSASKIAEALKLELKPRGRKRGKNA
ncbi:MAG: helix-turn-helix domain-containing protein [Planctomycetota bacterium]|jgi:transcriptional regulator with XRE-family HTH domain